MSSIKIYEHRKTVAKKLSGGTMRKVSRCFGNFPNGQLSLKLIYEYPVSQMLVNEFQLLSGVQLLVA
jgi:hypothetical protein